MAVDFSHPLHAASLYVEELKYGPGPRALERVNAHELVTQFDGLLRDLRERIELGHASPWNIDVAELLEDTAFYGESFEQSMRIPMMIGRSIFIDGLLHGLALAGGLAARSAQ